MTLTDRRADLYSHVARDHRTPGLGPAGVDSQLERRRIERVHGKPLREAAPDLGLRDAARPHRAGLLVAEAKQGVPAPRRDPGPQVLDLTAPALRAEDVEQSAADR